MLDVIGHCLLDVFGGLGAAALVAAAGWNLLKLIRLPEIGPFLALAALAAIPGALRSPFVQMTLLFLGIAALALLGEGRAWRRKRRMHDIVGKLATGTYAPAHRIDPLLHRR